MLSLIILRSGALVCALVCALLLPWQVSLVAIVVVIALLGWYEWIYIAAVLDILDSAGGAVEMPPITLVALVTAVAHGYLKRVWILPAHTHTV